MILYDNKTWLRVIGILFVGLFLFYVLEVYTPNVAAGTKVITYSIQSGQSAQNIANDLEKQQIISNATFFRLYAFVSGQYGKLQAGKYDVSSSVPIYRIVDRLAAGDVLKFRVRLLEGWTIQDMSEYVDAKDFYTSKSFINSAKKDWSAQFSFLKDKPKKMDVEGYVFPDTYTMYPDDTVDALVEKALSNFDKKLTPDLRAEIAKQHKTIFQIVTMASIIEKEASNTKDKKIISGILWKRIKNGMPLQVDSTINFITGRSDAKATIKDTKIDSPYNTYRYQGLPLGPISNPGIDSILAAIYPTDSPYWYYLAADGTGETIFSKTLAEHQAAIDRYFK